MHQTTQQRFCCQELASVWESFPQHLQLVAVSLHVLFRGCMARDDADSEIFGLCTLQRGHSLCFRCEFCFFSVPCFEWCTNLCWFLESAEYWPRGVSASWATTRSVCLQGELITSHWTSRENLHFYRPLTGMRSLQMHICEDA